MAQRRMFSLLVTDTDSFLDMPLSTQALYFHLGMHGDDEGFVGSPRKIARSIGCNADDLKVLAAKGFIIAFESGVVVIRDWNINNTLRNDRFHPTIYTEEKALVSMTGGNRYELASNMATVGIPHDNHVATVGIPSDNQMEPELNITKHNITKPNLTKPSISADSRKNRAASGPDFDRFWTAYPNKKGKGAARTAFSKALAKGVSVEDLITAVERQKHSRQWTRDNGDYIPHPATWLNQERWEDAIEAEPEEDDSWNPFLQIAKEEHQKNEQGANGGGPVDNEGGLPFFLSGNG